MPFATKPSPANLNQPVIRQFMSWRQRDPNTGDKVLAKAVASQLIEFGRTIIHSGKKRTALSGHCGKLVNSLNLAPSTSRTRCRIFYFRSASRKAISILMLLMRSQRRRSIRVSGHSSTMYLRHHRLIACLSRSEDGERVRILPPTHRSSFKNTT